MTNVKQATDIQRVFRGYMSRVAELKKLQMKFGANDIQRVFRGFIGRKAFLKRQKKLDRKKTKELLNALYAKKADEAIKKEVTVAVEKKKEEVKKVEEVVKQEQESEMAKRRREYAERNEMLKQQLLKKKEDAALIFQRVLRGRRSRRQVKGLLDEAKTQRMLDEVAKAQIENAIKEEQAVIPIQLAIKNKLARKRLEEAKNVKAQIEKAIKQEEAAGVLTAVVKRKLAEGVITKKQAAKAKQEAFIKAEEDKKEKARLKREAFIKEQERASKIASITEKFKKKKENAAATIIQKLFLKKGKELPKAEEVPVVDTNKAATTLQTAMRGRMARNKVKRVNDAITKLQSAIRNANAKKTLEALKPKIETEIVEVKSEEGKKGGWGFSLSFISDAVKAVNDAVSNTVDEALKAREKGKAISKIQAGVRRNTAMMKYKEELKAYRLEVKALQDAQKALEVAKGRQEKVEAVVNVLSNTADKIKGGFGYLFGGRGAKAEEPPKEEAPKSKEKTKEELDKEQKEFDLFMANAQREYEEREAKRKAEEEEAKKVGMGGSEYKLKWSVKTIKILKGNNKTRTEMQSLIDEITTNHKSALDKAIAHLKKKLPDVKHTTGQPSNDFTRFEDLIQKIIEDNNYTTLMKYALSSTARFIIKNEED